MECKICLWLKLIYNQGFKIILFHRLSITILSYFSFSPTEDHQLSTEMSMILIAVILVVHGYYQLRGRGDSLEEEVILKYEWISRSSGGHVETDFGTASPIFFRSTWWVLRICICYKIPGNSLTLLLANRSSHMARISLVVHVEV